MNRYNQGFLKLGPMEQSNDGEWIKYSEYEELKLQKQRLLDSYIILNEQYVRCNEEYNLANTQRSNAILSAFIIAGMFVVSVIFNIVMLYS